MFNSQGKIYFNMAFLKKKTFKAQIAFENKLNVFIKSKQV